MVSGRSFRRGSDSDADTAISPWMINGSQVVLIGTAVINNNLRGGV